MAATHVLRVRRTDDPSANLLLNVTQTSKTRPLDLKLVATEHEHVYVGSLKSANLAALQASNYRGDDDEWKAIVAYVLLHQRPDANLDALQGLEAVAAISGETCTLTLRKNIGGITQRLGSIKLKQDEEEEVSPFDWVEIAVATSDDLRSELVTLQASLGSQRTQVDALSRQLDDLVKAKKEHEEELLRKCAVLLDSKRAKIRDQQRELSAATKSQSGKNTHGSGREAGRSAPGKRKAGPTASEEDEDGLDLDPVDEEDDDELVEEEEEGQRTPEQDTDDGASDDGFAPPPTRSQPPTSSGGKRGGKAAGKGTENGAAKEVSLDEMPPRRELPFARRTAPNAQQPDQNANGSAGREDDEEDDTDDEL